MLRLKRTPLPRRAGPRLLLAAAAAVVLLVGAQTLLALRSQQRMAHRVLHDHAATALWYFEQNLQSELTATVECALHDVLHVSSASGQPHTLRIGVPHTTAPPARRLLDTWFDEGQCASAAVPRPGAAFRFGPGPDMDVAGERGADRLARELRPLVEEAVAEQAPLRRTDGMVAGRVAGEPLVVFYSQQRVPGGEAIYAVALDGGALGPAVDRAVREFRLLPPPVLPSSGHDSVMRLTVGVAGAVLYEIGADGPAVASGTRILSGLGGLEATAEITAAGARLLAQPPLPPGRLSALLGLLLLSLLLVALAYRQIRREQELATLRGDFVASVSHELRTPLALQRIFLDTIRLGRATSPESLAWAHENLDREGRRLEHLVNNILHFARSERGQLELDPVRADLLGAVQRVGAAYRPLAEQRGMVIEISGRSGLAVELDEPAFHQALGNVLENAVKYGPEGQRITVRVSAAAPWAAVEVEDRGPGLPPDERALVLQPFRRGRDSRGGAVAGSGIGLAVAREVMTLHGGRISLGEAEGGGLHVRLVLPLQSPPMRAGPAAQPPVGAAPVVEERR